MRIPGNILSTKFILASTENFQQKIKDEVVAIQRNGRYADVISFQTLIGAANISEDNQCVCFIAEREYQDSIQRAPLVSSQNRFRKLRDQK